MAVGWKKTTRRSTNTLRVLAQLTRAESPYLERVLRFLRELWQQAEENPRITIEITKTDGFRAYHDDQCLFYMQVNRRSWALLLTQEKNHRFFPEVSKDEGLGRKVRGSHDAQRRISSAAEFDRLLQLVRALPRSARKTEGSRTRVVPAWAQEQAWERFNANGSRCENPKCQRRQSAGFSFHIDHKLPLSKDGSSVDPENLQILCDHCNLSKSARFRDFVIYR